MSLQAERGSHLDRADLARGDLPESDLADVKGVIIAADANLSHAQARFNTARARTTLSE
jgi:hypothetical protein